MDYLSQLLAIDVKCDINQILQSVGEKLDQVPDEQLDNIYKIVKYFFNLFFSGLFTLIRLLHKMKCKSSRTTCKKNVMLMNVWKYFKTN